MKIIVCDFETTTFDSISQTEVWASACVEMYTEDVKIFHSLDETMCYFDSLKCHILAYYHNLKFDGSFIIDWLLRSKFKPAFDKSKKKFLTIKDMPKFSYIYSISQKGLWYSITIKFKFFTLEIRDSLKLLPFSVSKIGEDFKTKHRKLDMTYIGYRYAGCNISENEKEYIKNDVLVVKEALEIMYNEGHKKMTIGSCCLSEYKAIFSDLTGGVYGRFNKDTWEKYFPDLYSMEDISEKYSSIGHWLIKSYKGGWCYVAPECKCRILKGGLTADVNSLYPSMMHSKSDNVFPVGLPTYWKGENVPEECFDGKHYFFIRVRCAFEIKEGFLPFIQIKGDFRYKGNENLTTSKVKINGEYVSEYIDMDGTINSGIVELTFTQTDWVLFQEHYIINNLDIIDGYYFKAVKGIFDDYINKYMEIKKNSKGAKRQIAKLFLNNLYGKFATYIDSSFKVAYLKDNNAVGFKTIHEEDKKAGYIPIGSAITSYSRNFTIRSAQKNYHPKEGYGFAYADTDSIHCYNMDESQLIDIDIHESNLCCWKIESHWKTGWFVRQKTYIEEIGNKLDIKCAGLPERGKKLLEYSITGNKEILEELKDISENEKKFITKKRNIKDFNIGIKIPGKLSPKRIKGGIVLIDTEFYMH